MVDHDAVCRRAIAVSKVLLGREIVIQTDADLSPTGKRTARIVRHQRTGRRTNPQIRWYVAGKIYRTLPITEDNVKLTAKWRGLST
ncbi:hypothetical protein ACI77O_12695 [Pseudomonas tritici]|uniref:hypothetical protein n=1 Tax=Pseudomonas tritici TaxID=2745518 RepID=UPI00387B55E4